MSNVPSRQTLLEQIAYNERRENALRASRDELLARCRKILAYEDPMQHGFIMSELRAAIQKAEAVK